MSKRCYAVVGFSSDNSTEVVPTSWLHDGKDEVFNQFTIQFIYIYMYLYKTDMLDWLWVFSQDA